jgi:hypothetical protein
MGHFVLNNGSELEFPSSMHLAFDFREASANRTLEQLLYGGRTALEKVEQLKRDMEKLGLRVMD